MGVEGAEAQRFLDEFVKEFPDPLGPDDPLPVSPLSSRLSQDEIRGESLDLAGRLLAARNAPPLLSAALSHAGLEELLKSDLTPFHCPPDPEQESTSVLLQSEPLQRLFFNKLREVGFAWQQRAPAPASPPSRPLLTSVHAIRNARRKMEDRHVALPEFNQLFGLQDGVERGYYAVFDGHGGVDAATYAATHLHVALSQHEELQSDPAAALKSAFTRTDDMFREKAKRERLRSGSTGVAILLSGDWLHVAWLGDSQVMLVSQGQPVTLMEPHKPEREDEKQRIEDLGGCIAFMGCWRVNGTYAVSRAIGDFDQKPYISNEADCASVRLSGKEDYVLLACDGFFDTVQPADVPGLVLEALRDSGGQGGPAAQRLVSQAKSAGSSDNITVLLVFLRDPEQLLREAEGDADHPRCSVEETSSIVQDSKGTPEGPFGQSAAEQ
ncbi:protein phosphatase 1F [Megalops cyprinoides]|uniref:protein phosphatase 1F n=1 Tax=Megalops cyprinoides TaxID=118141 RepID=UPI0018655014|nr:protein phosphatase 1F [Megalops cyprinoides]